MDIQNIDLDTLFNKLIQDSKGVNTALNLSMHFKELKPRLLLEDSLKRLAKFADFKMTLNWIEEMQTEVKDKFIKACAENGEIKKAWNFACKLNRYNHHPEIQKIVKKQEVRKMISQKQWGKAFFVAGRYEELQVKRNRPSKIACFRRFWFLMRWWL